MGAGKMTELNTSEYLDAGGDPMGHDKDLVTAQHLFFHKLGKMIGIGIPVLSCLRFITKETSHDALRNALSDMQDSIENGQGLAESMDKPVFSPSTIVMIKVGEVTGKLDQAALAISECLGKQLATM